MAVHWDPAAERELGRGFVRFGLRLFVLSAVLAMQACSKPSVTGSYVFTDPTTIDYFTLVQSPDGHVEGKKIFASTTWQDVSGFAQIEGRLSGTMEGNVLNVTLTSQRWREPTRITGTFDGKYLVLTSHGAFPMRYTPITPERYAAMRKELIAGQKLESTVR